MDELHEFHRLAKSIVKNSKGEVLLTALRRGFEAAAKARGEHGGAPLQQKAVIFTESRRTQDYLFQLLEKNGVRRQGDAVQRHQHRSHLEGHLCALAGTAPQARTA